MNRGSVLLQDLPPIRSIHTDEGRILIGTGNDEVITRYNISGCSQSMQLHARDD